MRHGGGTGLAIDRLGAEQEDLRDDWPGGIRRSKAVILTFTWTALC